MTYRLKLFGQIVITFLLILSSYSAIADVPPPEPPLKNPHSPVTKEDKKRVAFAELAIQQLLMRIAPAEERPIPTYGIHNPSKNIKLNLDESCLKKAECLYNNPQASQYITSINYQYGPLTELRHVHIIPWSFEKFTTKKEEKKQKQAASQINMIPQLNEDEYMIHSYVRFGTGTWFHLNTIVTEDTSGNLKLRRFYIIEMPVDNLPPGVKC